MIWVAFLGKPTKEDVNRELIHYSLKRAYMYLDRMGFYNLYPSPKRIEGLHKDYIYKGIVILL